MKLPLVRFWPSLLLGLALSAPLAEAQSNYFLYKNQSFRQTGANTVVPDPIKPFEFEVSGGTNLVLTLPSGAPAPVTLTYANDGEDEEFIFRKAFPTKAAMDALFPPGAYRMTGTGLPNLTLNLPDTYLALTPQVTSVTNGTWNAGGLLVVNPTQAMTINLTPAADFSTGGMGYMSIGVWGFTEQTDIFETEVSSVAGFGVPVQASSITSFTLPANRMVNGRIYHVTVELQRVPTADLTSIPGGSVVSVLGKSLGFYIYAQTGTAAPAAPTIPTSPSGRTAASGSSTTFTVNPVIPGAAQNNNIALWFKDGFELDQSLPRFTRTGTSIRVDGLTIADAGDYLVEVVGPGGVVRSTPATLTIPVVPALPRVANLSILTTLAAGDSFTMGYVVGGANTSGNKPLVIRAVGPSLSAVGVTGFVDDPKLELFAGATKRAENDNWGGSAALTNAMAAVGAFGFTGAGSRDAAATADITSSDNSVKVSAVGANGGTVLAEVYDATPSASLTAATPRLINVSVLKNIGTGLTVGFVLDGSTTKTIFVRAIGPTLGTAFSVPGVVADPQLALFSSSQKIGENNDWGGTLALTTAFAQVAAFALPPASKDAALLATLPPGNYSVQVSGVGGSSGTALVEVYELP